MSWEAIGGVCGIIGVFVFVYQFKYLPQAELKSAKNNLYALFGTSQRLVNTLIADLKEYAEEHDYHDLYFSQLTTFRSHITHLEHLRDTELSDEVFQELKSLPLTKDYIATMMHNLNNQIHSFNNIQAHFNTAFKFAS